MQKFEKKFKNLVDQINDELESLPKIKAEDIVIDDIPKTAGIYVWYEKDVPVYVGKASGSGGLRARIKQHLNPKYVETRIKKKDQEFADKTENVGAKKFMEKSALRVAICREKNLCPGDKVLSYLKKKLTLTWVIVPDLEMNLISKLKPKYNTINPLKNK